MNFKTLIFSLAAAAACLMSASACMKMDGGDMDDNPEHVLTVIGTVIDADNSEPVSGIVVTMYGYTAEDSTAYRATDTFTTDVDGIYVVSIINNAPGDWFKISAVDPKGVWTSNGIDYIGWDGTDGLLKGQTIVVRKAGK